VRGTLVSRCSSTAVGSVGLKGSGVGAVNLVGCGATTRATTNRSYL